MTEPAARTAEINRRLARRYPDAKCSLDFTNAFELLIATILSAQSTDVRINMVTKVLFRKYPDAAAFAAADLVEMETDVKQTGFFRNKAKAVINCGKALVERHGGVVPSTMEDLTALPGVGRKTANVVLSNAMNKPVGMVVDTHVARVAGRLALTASADAEVIEQDLMALLPKKDWTSFGHRVIYHGRQTCIARKPLCEECVVNDLCPSAQLPTTEAPPSPPSSRARSARSATPPEPPLKRARASGSSRDRKPSR